jgi:uncharacterized protein YjbI with pentapeptide repeats
MADDEHVAMLRKGMDAWNEWRDENLYIHPDLSSADLSGANLSEANLSGAELYGVNLSGADLSGANLSGADLSGANLSGVQTYLNREDLAEEDQRWPGGALDAPSTFTSFVFPMNDLTANLSGADLSGADLSGADLRGADLSRAYLSKANLSWANLSGAELNGAYLFSADLSGADLSGAFLEHTVFGSTTLSEVKGLDRCKHVGPSIVDFQTLKNSGPLPIAFLRGVGLSDTLIDYLPSLLNEAIQFYSCFISYSSKDQAFAERLHADLQNKGVRCWFAPHDMPIGAKIIDALDEAIRLPTRSC